MSVILLLVDILLITMLYFSFIFLFLLMLQNCNLSTRIWKPCSCKYSRSTPKPSNFFFNIIHIFMMDTTEKHFLWKWFFFLWSYCEKIAMHSLLYIYCNFIFLIHNYMCSIANDQNRSLVSKVRFNQHSYHIFNMKLYEGSWCYEAHEGFCING